MTVAIEVSSEHLLGNRETDGVRQPLAERAGGGLDARRLAVLGMARRLGMQLAELLEIVDRQCVAGEMQQRVQQHRAVSVGEHEAVAIPPRRIRRIVLKEIAPQDFGDVGHAHRRARVARVRFLYGVHRQRADGVRQRATVHCYLVWLFSRGNRGVHSHQSVTGNKLDLHARRLVHVPGKCDFRLRGGFGQ